MDDRELLEGLHARDVRALEELYDRHARAAFGLALRVAGDRGLAETAVADGFLDAWRAPLARETDREVAAWVHGLVRRRAREAVRERRREGPAGPDGSGGRSDESRAAAGAWARLAPRERRLLELVYFDGVDAAALAELLGLDLAEVGLRVAAALRAFHAARSRRAADRKVPGTSPRWRGSPR